MIALGAVLALACAGSALAYKPTIVKVGNLPPPGLSGGFSPTKLPKSKLAPIHLSISGDFETLSPPLPALEEAIFENDRNVAVNAKGLAICTPGKFVITEMVPRWKVCKPAWIGEGEMEFEIAFPESSPFPMKSHAMAFNGGVKGGVTTILIHTFLKNPVSAAVVITVKITKIHKGRYGTKWVATVPVIAGGSGSVKKFNLEFFREFTYKRKKRSYLLARCPDGRLQGHAEALFADGSKRYGDFVRPAPLGVDLPFSTRRRGGEVRGWDQALGLLAALAATQHPLGEDRDAEDRGGAEAELDAEQALARPVDVAQVEQQCRLVEGEAHADAGGYREALFQRLVFGQQRRGAGGEGDHDAGHEVVDVPPAQPDIAERPPALPDPPGGEAHQGEGAEEAGKQVEEDGFAARGRRIAADRDIDRVDRGGRSGLGEAVRACRFVGAASQHATELARQHHSRAAQRDRGEGSGGALGARPSETGSRRGAAADAGWQASGAHLAQPSCPLSVPR